MTVFIRVFLGLLLVCLAMPSYAETDQSFAEFLNGMRARAVAEGVSQRTVDEALPVSQFALEKVIALDGKQPEKTITFAKYRTNVLPQSRIAEGRALMAQHAAILKKVEKEYGVPPQYIVALWGMETNYGKNTGGYNVVNSLATLAWHGRRREFFTEELLKALKIIDQGHITAAGMRGSWAGAMGQNQFMPSSFLKFAVDEDGDGHKNIWTSDADVFASTANYLSKSGWKHGQRWGRAVKAPAGFSDEKLIGRTVRKPLSKWQKLSFRQSDGSDLVTTTDYEASLIMPDGIGGPAYLVYDNYNIIMQWNRSTYFATSIGLLADALK